MWHFARDRAFACALVAVLFVAGGCGGGGLSVCAGSQPCVHYVSPAVGGNGASDDGSVADAADMARSGVPDLGRTSDAGLPAGDLATAADLAPACLPTGGDCSGHNDAACCSKYCVYATNSCR